MTFDFSDLRKKTTMDKLSDLVKKEEGNRFNDDEGYWKITKGADGSGSAVIRFLPPAPGSEIPIVSYFNHGFKGPGGWYIENCPTSIGQECPVCNHNNELWNSGIEANKDVARSRKRNKRFVANIYVVKDPGNPDNEGKVFRFQFGKKIYDKIKDAMSPPEDLGMSPINPFDMWEGANFLLRVVNKGGFPNYDSSQFDVPRAFLDSDEAREAVWKELQPLDDIKNPENFKEFDVLEAKFRKVLKLESSPPPRSAEKPAEDKPLSEEIDDEVPWTNDDTPTSEVKTADTSSVSEDDIDKWLDDLGE